MKVYMGVNGLGRGHAIRSYRLANALSREGYDIYISSYGDGYGTLKNLNTTNKCCKLIKLKGYSYVWLSKQLDWKRTILKGLLDSNKLLKHFISEINNINLINPDVVISDSRFSTCLATTLLGKSPILVTNQLSIFHTNYFFRSVIRHTFKYLWGKPKKIFIADLPPPYTISYVNNVPVENFFNNVEYVGLLLNLDNVNFVDYESRDIDILFIVSAPSGDREVFYMDTLKIASKLSRKGYTVAIIGHGQSIGNIGSIFIAGWVENSLEYLSRSKIVVLRGGHTAILESILYGVPMLVVPAPKQTEQEGNAISVKRLGIGSYVSYVKYYKEPFEVSRKIDGMISNIDEYVSNIKVIRKILININGFERVIEYIRYSAAGE